jgi:hypothetical protein
MTKPSFDTFKDSYDGIYRGKVVDNNDPEKAGKVKVEVYPMFYGITKADLPWAIPAYPIFEGSGSGFGYFAVPKVGTLVYCFFEAGNHYQPVYFAEAPSKIHGIPSSSETNYPDRKVMKTTSGLEFIIDDKDKVITINHPTGTYVQIAGNGSVIVNSLNSVVIKGLTVSINPL